MDPGTRSATETSAGRIILTLNRAPLKSESIQRNQAHRDAGQFVVGNVGRKLMATHDPGPLIWNPHGSAPRLGVEPKNLGVLNWLVHP